MPGLTHQEIDSSLVRLLSEFTAVRHYQDRHINLLGPEILYTYREPERAVEQGIFAMFRDGAAPVIVMVMEKLGDKVNLYASKLTEERVEVFRRGNLHTNLENNFASEALWLSSPSPMPARQNVIASEDIDPDEEFLGGA